MSLTAIGMRALVVISLAVGVLSAGLPVPSSLASRLGPHEELRLAPYRRQARRLADMAREEADAGRFEAHPRDEVSALRTI